jgi:hypothetical protein
MCSRTTHVVAPTDAYFLLCYCCYCMLTLLLLQLLVDTDGGFVVECDVVEA